MNEESWSGHYEGHWWKDKSQSQGWSSAEWGVEGPKDSRADRVNPPEFDGDGDIKDYMRRVELWEDLTLTPTAKRAVVLYY